MMAEKDTFLKKGHCNSYQPLFKPGFFCVLHQNKALYNFNKRGQGPKAGCCFCPD